MSQIFVSYKSSEKERVRPIVELLESQGWSVWWDRKIPPGKTFDQVIEEALSDAACVIVVWSAESVQSDWVKSEADEGARRRILVPVLIDDVPIPLGFRRIQAAKLTHLPRPADDPEVQGLVASVAKTLEQESRRRGRESTLMRLLRSEAREAEGGESTATGSWAARWWPSGGALALGGLLLLALGVGWLAPKVLGNGGPANGGAEKEAPSKLTFIGVDSGPENKEADDKLVRYLEGEARLPITVELRDYGTVITKLSNWDRDSGPFLARATPYVYVAAEMLGADLEILGTYRSRATGTTVYRSYFVVNRRDFPDHDRNNPPALDDLVAFLRSDAEARRRFIYHSQFSTSSYFLPSLFFRRQGIFHMERSTERLAAIESGEIVEDSSTELVKRVARGSADFAAVWDGTRAKFEPDGSHWQEYGREVLFIPIATPLPNDLLVCSGWLHAGTKGKLQAAIGAMGDSGEDLIDVGDFLGWEEWLSARDAREALAELRQAASAPPVPVTVEIDASGGVPAAYLEAARRAVRLSGTEFVVFDPDFHGHADFLWKLTPEHDGALRLTSSAQGLSEHALKQEYWISFADEQELTGRISTFIHSRMHRVRYLWPYDAEHPTVIRDVGFSIPVGAEVIAQQVTWRDPERGEITQGQDFVTRVEKSDFYKLHLDAARFPRPDGRLRVDPLSNVAYRVILVRPSQESVLLRALGYLFVALLLLAAAGAVVDVWQRRRRPPGPGTVKIEVVRDRGASRRPKETPAPEARAS